MRGTLCVAALTVVASTVAGCASDIVDGEAEAIGAVEPAFSPCDDIPDDVIEGLGLDPASETRDLLGVELPGWRVCDWQGERHGISVYATTYTQGEFRASPEFEDFFDADVPGRDAFGFRELNDTDRISCDIAVESAGGVVAASAGIHAGSGSGDSTEACGIALDAMNALVHLIPE